MAQAHGAARAVPGGDAVTPAALAEVLGTVLLLALAALVAAWRGVLRVTLARPARKPAKPPETT